MLVKETGLERVLQVSRLYPRVYLLGVEIFREDPSLSPFGIDVTNFTSRHFLRYPHNAACAMGRE